MISFKEKYGPVALVAGASEGMGAAYAHALAAHGLDLVLIARRVAPLETTAREIAREHAVNVLPVACDLAAPDATQQIIQAIGDREIGFLVYNAAQSYIGPYLATGLSTHLGIAAVNATAPLAMLHYFGGKMAERKRGGIVLMASIAGFQGSGYLATYAATKAFNRVLAEGLWYEWKPLGVDVIACCAGATATPNYLNTQPGKASWLEPKPQRPEQVVEECLSRVGTAPSFVSGAGNKLVSFLMQRLLPRKAAIRIMGDGMKKMYRILPVILLSVLCLFFAPAGSAWSQPVALKTPQRIATLEVDISRPMNGMAVPAEVDLDAITFLPDSALELLKIQSNEKIFPIPFQIDEDGRRTLHWIVNPQLGKKAIFELVTKTPFGGADPQDSMRAVADNGELIISDGDQHLLQYVYKTVYPPAGIDTAYKKSGFIHPLWSPHGQVLTRIQAPDHYHHYGVWDPWTHVLYKGDTVDFWNLKDRKGTVRFTRFASIVSGPVFAQYEALQEHVVFHKDGGEEVAMNEVQTVRVYRSPYSKDYYFFDLTIQLNCATPNPVLLLAYRYGGVGWRATADWNKDNSEVLTSEGKTRKEADGSKARWCIVQGAVDGDYAGAEMMSYPGNYNYPEPLRVWPENSNGRGDMYANFSPTKDIDWPLEPGHNYVLRYRWVVFNGHFSKEKAESAWQYFSTPVKVTIIH